MEQIRKKLVANGTVGRAFTTEQVQRNVTFAKRRSDGADEPMTF